MSYTALHTISHPIDLDDHDYFVEATTASEERVAYVVFPGADEVLPAPDGCTTGQYPSPYGYE